MQSLGVESGTGEPQAQGGLASAEDALQGIQRQTFGEQRED